MNENNSLDLLSINTIKLLSVDAVEKAKSGHPGAPMGAAPMAYVLWKNFLQHNPSNPKWINRDRFILSPGHASALLYSLLHLTGYDVDLKDLEQFRQLESKTPGHPEYGITPGVEVTTGPLGQGFANGVGMAISEAKLAADFNTEEHQIIDHFTYGIVSDGDLQEGVASEAASLAGTLKLNKLIYLYDSNNISIEGDTNLSFTENVADRFTAYNWQVIGPINGSNLDEIHGAITQAKAEISRPSLIICETVIGNGSPNKSGKPSAHGEPLGTEEVVLTKQQLGWQYENPFTVPESVKAHFAQISEKGIQAETHWNNQIQNYKSQHPERYESLISQIQGNLPNDWGNALSGLFDNSTPDMATRESSGIVINKIAGNIPGLIGGSADLAPSTKTNLNDFEDYNAENRLGRNFHFGVREHAMGSIANGIALHGGLIPFTSTFLVFSDYMKPSIRLAALMNQRVIFVFTHDSIGVGEDGPTHQPIEHLAALRSIPNLTVIRPADSVETVAAWHTAITRTNGPTAIILSRQSLPNLSSVGDQDATRGSKGGYLLIKSNDKPTVTIIATGSEVHLAAQVNDLLNKNSITANVVSMPSWEIFDEQSERYKTSVITQSSLKVSIEAASTFGWAKYVGNDGISIGIDTFGASAPGQTLFTHFGFSAQNIYNVIVSKLK
tara:strand:+ start:3526 stop:5532 length:2007 start_codon:yes stop_codon:yes gene_type:complete